MNIDYSRFEAEKPSIRVYPTPKFLEAVTKVTELIESGKFRDLDYSDFWIQQNRNKAGNCMIYSSLIISHCGCMKVNDALPEKLRFDVAALLDASGNIRKTLRHDASDTMTLEYVSKEQGVYEVASVSKQTCKIAYYDEMLAKRLFDRVVKVNSKLATWGIYGEDESEDFSRPVTVKQQDIPAEPAAPEKPAPTVQTGRPAQTKEKTPLPPIQVNRPQQIARPASPQPAVKQTQNAANQVTIPSIQDTPAGTMTLQAALEHCGQAELLGPFRGKKFSTFVFGDGNGLSMQEAQKNHQRLRMITNVKGADGMAASAILKALDSHAIEFTVM